MIERMAAWLERWLAIACSLVLALMLLLVVATAFQRYALSGGFLGAEEASIWLMLLLVALGFPLVAAGPLAMRIDLFPFLSGGLARLREAVAEMMVIVACLVLAAGGYQATLLLGGMSALLGLPEWMRFAAFALSGSVALLVSVLRLLRNWPLLHVVLIAGIAAGFWLAVSLTGSFLSFTGPGGFAALIIAAGILAGASLPHTFIVGAFGAIAAGSPLTEPAVVGQLVTGTGRYLLLAIPFFLLAGSLLVVSGMAEKLVRFASVLVGGGKSGAGQTVLLTSVIFSGTSGSSIANASFSARTFFRPLIEKGYTPERAGGLIAATAVLDNIIPPSIAFFILAAATNLSVGRLLTGGLAAGLTLALVLALVIQLTSRETRAETETVAASQTASQSVWKLGLAAVPAFVLGIIVVAGIRFGVVTPTEASGLAAGYTLAVALMASARNPDILAAFRESAVTSSSILVLIGSATPLAFILATSGIGAFARDAALIFGEDPLLFMLAANLFLLAVGLVLDIGAAILLFGPIMIPVAVAVGIDPVWFGVILVVNLMIGGLTPPVGILVQVTSTATGVPALNLFRAVIPYLCALIATLIAMSMAVAVFS